MAHWPTFSAAAPTLAVAIRDLLHQYGPGFAYLATVRPDGGPRVHPVSPVVTDGGLYCFVVRSPKRFDLDRDGRYALHAYPPEDSDDEAYLAGRAMPVVDAERRQMVASAYHAAPRVDWRLYEFTIDVAMLASYHRRVTWPPKYVVWRDPASLDPTPAC
ncbi:MAG: hypothetical protein ACRDTU_12170 [Micromonosporaceae bacterium]